MAALSARIRALKARLQNGEEAFIFERSIDRSTYEPQRDWFWFEGDLAQRRELQHAIFHEGLPFDGREFGTARTCLAFKQLRTTDANLDGVASRL